MTSIARKIVDRLNVFRMAAALLEEPCDPIAFDRIHFACGNEVRPGWLNVDLKPAYRFAAEDRKRYLRINICEKNSFPDGHFRFGYSQDFIEHLSQADSITFLSEAYRILALGGVLRTSTPGLEGVLKSHYRRTNFSGAAQGKIEAYDSWGHVHFYSRDSIETVARHLGFRKIEIKPANESDHPELRNLDTRLDQSDLNLIVELTK